MNSAATGLLVAAYMCNIVLYSADHPRGIAAAMAETAFDAAQAVQRDERTSSEGLAAVTTSSSAVRPALLAVSAIVRQSSCRCAHEVRGCGQRAR